MIRRHSFLDSFFRFIAAEPSRVLLLAGLALLVGLARSRADGAFSEATIEKTDVESHLKPGLTNSIGMRMVLIPRGEFLMGSPESEAQRVADETRHRVTLSRPFYMGATEVTQAQWSAVMGENPSFFTGDSLPVDTVTWEDASEFCRKLSLLDEATYRLPTEAEWEYACRAGTSTAFHTGATIRTDEANYNGNFTYGDGPKGLFREESTEVGAFPPNAWGLHDMHGNVWEWCGDWYAAYPDGPAIDPSGPEEGEFRVVRGGCWINFPAVCRSANRGKTRPVSWNFHFGFRVVREAD